MERAYQNLGNKIIYWAMAMALAFLIFLTGCKFESTSNIYVTDLLEVQNSKKPVLAESTIKFEIMDKSTYEENKGRLKDLLSRHFSEVKNLSCEETGLETFVVARTKIPIWFNQNIEGTESSTQILSVLVSPLKKEKESFLKIFLAIAKDKYLALKNDFENEFPGTTLNADDFEKITVILQNGQKNPITVFGICVYVDGQPEPIGCKIVLEKRNSVELTIPKISIAKAFDSGRSPFLIFKADTSSVTPEKIQPQSTPKKNSKNMFQKYKNKK
jgi:hypothetical protein